ncbi:MAG: HNH endonuclease [Pirellulales bacterium]|nr:HNH endonuclease [Pirellulales bacterium]
MRVYIPVEIARRVRQAAHNRCGDCLSPQHLVMARLQFEHLLPRVKGGLTSEDNLWLSCPLCNAHKGDQVSARDPETGETVTLFNPRTQDWFEHFRWSEDGLRIVGLTPTGRATVAALHLSDDPDAIQVRSYWVLAGWHPPRE